MADRSGNSENRKTARETKIQQSFFKSRAGVRVVLDEHKLGIIIRKLPDDDVDLDSLVRRITKKNRHEEIDWGPPVGTEVW